MAKESKNECWKDITEEFVESAKQLQLGELLNSNNFTLVEAMSAIELMDPKMDNGRMLKKINRRVLTLEQSVKLGLVKVNNLELKELIGIIDDTYSGLTTWLAGYSLAHTVMTNLYLHEPERIEDRCLRVFSQAILKIVDFIDKLVLMVGCFEEEDFQLNVFKFNLGTNLNEQRVLNSLEDVCQYYEKILAQMTTTATTKSQSAAADIKQPSDQEEELPQITFDQSLLVALINRLRFTQNFYSCFMNINKNILKDHLDALTEAQLTKTIKTIQSSVQNCDQNLEKCLTYLEKWVETIDVGIKPEGEFCEGDHPRIMGFEPFINHKLLPAAYPRCPAVKTRTQSAEYLIDLIIRLRHCIRISANFNQKMFFNSVGLFENFSKYYKLPSCVVSRSFLQVLFIPKRSSKILRDELLQDMTEFCEPLVQSMKKNEVTLAALNEFLKEASLPFFQIVHLYGLNTARQYERFQEIILNFKNIHYSAFHINNVFNNSILYAWTTCQLAKVCIKYIEAGLELELFSAHEYPYVFWYLYDILYRNEREYTESAKQAIFESQMNSDQTKDQKKGGKAKKQRKKVQINTRFHDRSLMCNDAFRFLTGGIFLLSYGLRLQGKIKSPSMDFTSEEICFDHRFGLLTGASVYQSYRQTLSRLVNLEQIYREAFECFLGARELFGTIIQHEACLKVCKTNMIVASILSKDPNSFSDREIEWSFEIHRIFPIVKV